MSTVEITSELALTVPTPVRIATGGKGVPDARALVLRDGNRALPAQRDGDAVIAILGPFTQGQRKRFTLEAGSAPGAGVTLTPGNKQTLEITVGGKPFTTYVYDPELVRPFFYPVLGPGGKAVTRSYPMKPDVPGETKDHPHHKSFWTAYGEVNGADIWGEGRNHGFIRHQGFKQQSSGPVFGGFTEENLWTGPDEKPILKETRTIRIYNTGDERRLMDYDVTLSPSSADVTFGDTKEGGIIAFRVASSMDGNKGGRIENADGLVGEEKCWGKRSNWCDYSGTVDGTVVGVAVMDHPGNFRHPAYWHVRGYGLMGSNYFGENAFQNMAGDKGAYTLKNGSQLAFRYRVLIHGGNAQQGHVSDVYHGWIQAPEGKVVG